MKMNKVKRLLTAGILCGVLGVNFGSTVITAHATEGVTTTENGELTPEEIQQREFEEKVRKAYELPVQTNELTGWPQAVGTYGDAAIVMDAETGAVLYAKNIDKQEYPASITKLLTALLVYEYDAMNLNVNITEACQECIRAGYAHIGLDPGNVITMEQAMHAMLLASSNDVAYAIGETIAQSQGQTYEWFLERMNERCRELGGINSNFVNTNGVFNESHYSCAWDMAVIAKELFSYPEFFEICKTPQYVIPASPTTEEHVFQQNHHMLVEGYRDYYPSAIGGKTGFTTEAQNTLVTMADNGDRKLVCVVLYEYPGYVYSDTRALLDYGFANFNNVSIEKDMRIEDSDFPEDASVVLPNGIGIEAIEMEVTDNEETGGSCVTYYYGNNPVGVYQLSEHVQEEKPIVEVEQEEDEVETEAEDNKGFLKKIMIAAVAIVIFVVILLWIYIRIKRYQKKKRRRRRNRRKRVKR